MKFSRVKWPMAMFCFWIGGCAMPSQSAQPVEGEQIADPMAMHLAGVERSELAGWQFRLAPDDAYLLAWKARGSGLARNEYLDLDLRFYRRGKPLQGLHVDVLGWMPEHEHGFLRRAEVQELSPGVFLVSGVLFHMRGQWELTFDVSFGNAVNKMVFELEF